MPKHGMKTVMFDGIEYSLSRACNLAQISPGATRQHMYTYDVTAQTAFDHMRGKKAETRRRAAPNANKLPVKPYEKWTPPKPDTET